MTLRLKRPVDIPGILCIFIILIVGVFYIATIPDGYDLYGDSPMYILHSKNISEGIDYRKTGYIYNPYYPSLGPKAYPPIFPLLLAPVYKCFGLNFRAMRTEIVLFFLFSLLTIFMVFRNQLPSKYIILIIAFLGFNPYFWDFKNDITSDIPFLFFVYLSIFFVNIVYLLNSFKRNQIQYIALIAILFYLSFGTRYIGIALIPSLFIYDIIKLKKPSLFPVRATLIFIFFIIIQHIFLGVDISCLDQLRPSFRAILSGPLSYFHKFYVFWDNGYSWIVTMVLSLIISTAMIIGYFIKIKNSIAFFDIFFLLYLIGIIIWPARQGGRYLIPIFPLYIFYVFICIENIKFLNPTSNKKGLALIILTTLIFATYIAKYSKVDWGPVEGEVNKKETVEFLEYIKEKTNKEDVFIFRQPRALALFTGRKVSAYHKPHDDEELWSYFRMIDAAYICSFPDDVYLNAFINRHKERLQNVYSNTDFKLYKIRKNEQG